MIHLEGLTKYRESKRNKQSYVFMLLQFFFSFFFPIPKFYFKNSHGQLLIMDFVVKFKTHKIQNPLT